MKKNLQLVFTVKRMCSAFVFLFLITQQFTFAQTWQWAKSPGGNGPDNANKICTDASGNVYVAGYFSSSSINVGTVNITNSGITGTDVYVAKYDPTGNVVWAQRIGGSSSEYVTGICTDATGKIYVSGTYNSPFVALSPYTYTNTGSGTSNVYLACFNSNGSTYFLNGYGGTGNEYSGGVAFSNSQSAIYLTGTYFDPTFVVNTTTLTNTSSTGKAEAYLLKIASTGVLIWGRSTGSAGCDDWGSAIDVDATGNPCFSGTYSGTVTIPTTTIGGFALTSIGNQDMYVAKYNISGTPLWSKSIGSTAGGDYVTSMCVDALDNVLIGGYVQNANLVAGTFTVPGGGNYDGFIVKYNASGSVQWAKGAADGMMDDFCYGVDTDPNNNVYITGSFNSPTISIAATGTLSNSTSSFTSDMYVAMLNSSGTFQWAAKGNSVADEYGNSVTSDAVGNIYACGSYTNIVIGTTTLATAGGTDGYVAKIGCLTTGVSGPSNVCTGSSATLTASGATTYSWSTGATTSSIVITPTANVTYTVVGTTGGCVGTQTTISVNFLNASLATTHSLSLLCKQKAQITTTCSPSATAVVWSPSSNLSSSTVLSPTVTATSGMMTYVVTATLSNGCVQSDFSTISSYAQTPNICMVTVDSLGNNNEIYWEKTLYPQADSFIVYRETSLNTYKRIGGVKYSSFSMYTDTNRSIGPANGNPNLTYYKYKLQIKDSCGNVSPMSLWHETIFIQDQLNGNFNWNSYAIESSSPPISNYNLKRRDVSTGTETLVVSTVGNLATDPAYNSFWPIPTIKWFVDAIGFSCAPSLIVPKNSNQIMLTKTKTKSNQSNDKLILGIAGYDVSNVIKIYPNPAHDFINVDLNGLDKIETVVEIRNVLGQTVYSTTALNQYLNISTVSLAGGVYMVNIIQNNKPIAIKKVVVEK